MTNTRTATFTALAIAAAVAVTGCSSTTDGNPSPSTDSAAPSTTSTADGNVFGTLNACRVLDQLLAGQGFDPGDNESTRNECDASKLDFGTYSVALDPTQGLADFAASNPGATQTTINGRNAMQAQPTPTMCVYALEVGQKARALAMATMAYTTDDAQACPNAQQLAERLEPLLPKGR